jgi:hypothetical protein
LTGVGFVALAYWARKITVTTQTTVTDLVVLLQKGPSSEEDAEEKVALKDSNRATQDDNGSSTDKLQTKQSDVV